MNDAPVVAAVVSWDEVYPVVHLEAVGVGWTQQLDVIPADLAARYASAARAWWSVQRELKAYLREHPTPHPPEATLDERHYR